MSILLVLNSR